MSKVISRELAFDESVLVIVIIAIKLYVGISSVIQKYKRISFYFTQLVQCCYLRSFVPKV